MGVQPHSRFTIAAMMVIAAVLVIAAIMVYPNQGRTSTTCPTTTSTTFASLQSSEMTLSTSDYNSSLGLRLALSISNNTIPQDDGVSLHISLNNTLAEQNNVAPPSQNAFSNIVWQPSWNLMPCTTYSIGVQIFQGNYALGNLPEGNSPLNLIAPGIGAGCADHGRAEISFAPLSGNITSPVGWWINQSAASIEYWGSWGGVIGPPFQNAEFSSFQPGIYTVEGEDWWGQVTLLHFQVVTNENPLDCATIASNSSFVERTNFSASAGPLKLESYYQDPRSNNTVVLALTTTGNSTLAVGRLSLSNPYTNNIDYTYAPFQFSPNSTLSPQTWQYFAPDGTLSDPAVFYPSECSLVRVAIPVGFAGVPLLFYVGNQTQSFTLNP